jgi:hypothetical protein
LTLVGLTLLSLAATIVFAERHGRHYDLDAAGPIKGVHLALAKLTTALYLLPLATGLRTLADARALRWHRRAAYLVLVMTVVTPVTGTLMIRLAEPLPAARAPAAELDAPGR